MITSSFKARKSLAAIAVGTALMLAGPSAMAADACCRRFSKRCYYQSLTTKQLLAQLLRLFIKVKVS